MTLAMLSRACASMFARVVECSEWQLSEYNSYNIETLTYNNACMYMHTAYTVYVYEIDLQDVIRRVIIESSTWNDLN